jgi:hypothetical protein
MDDFVLQEGPAYGEGMITIRYADLPEGLYARAQAEGCKTVIYLRPGLTPAQRQEGLRRARQTARMGYGPRLPAAWVQAARTVDRCRITLRNATAAVSHHPASSALLAGVLAAAVACYVIFVSVSVGFVHGPRFIPAQGPLPAPVPARAAVPLTPGTAPPGGSQRGADAPGPAGSATAGRASHSPSPRGSSPPPTSPAPGPSPSPSPSASPTGVCLDVGPLGVCLSL